MFFSFSIHYRSTTYPVYADVNPMIIEAINANRKLSNSKLHVNMKYLMGPKIMRDPAGFILAKNPAGMLDNIEIRYKTDRTFVA